MLNRVVLMGRITQDLELKSTASGTSVTSFSIAVDRNYVKQGQQRQTDFINIVCWRQQAEFVCRYFGKGSMIALEGQIQSRTYQAKDGTNRYVTEVVVDNVSFTGERNDNNTNTANNGYAQPQQQAQQPQQPQQPQQQAQQPQQQVQQPQQQQNFGNQNQGYSNNQSSYSDYYEEMPDDDDLPF